MRISYLTLGIGAMAIAGCANLNTVDRASTHATGTAVHLDAPQRLAFLSTTGKVCAEPSPDSLQAYASSLGVGFGRSAAESLSIAQALSASSGSIGLRTQSITLMRDALYRVCEMYYSGALTEQQAAHLLQRSQDLTLAVLAIEQLTGAVTAQQVMLTSESSANAAATANDTQRELERAQSNEAEKKDTKEKLEKELEPLKKAAVENAAKAATAAAGAKPIKEQIDKLVTEKVAQEKVLGKELLAKISAEADIAVLKRREKTLLEAETERKVAAGMLHDKTEAARTALADEKKKPTPDQATVARLTVQLAQAEKDEKAANALVTQTTSAIVALRAEIARQQGLADTAAVNARVPEERIKEIDADLAVLKAQPAQVAYEAAAEAASKAAELQTKKEAALDAATKSYEAAQKITKELEKLGASAVTSAGASGKGAGQYSTRTDRGTIDADTAEIIAQTTVDIIHAVLRKGHLTDSCMVILMDARKRLSDETLEICHKVIDATLEVYLRTGGQAAPLVARGRNRHPGNPPQEAPR